MTEEKTKNETGGNETADKKDESFAANDARIEPDAIEPLRKENDNLRELLRPRDAREQMVGEFQKAGARSPGLLFAQAVDSLQFDSDGRVANAAAMVEKLKREFPEQFGRDVPPSIDAGAGRYSSISHLTKDTLSRMKPAEIARLDWSEVKRVLSEK